MSTIKTLPTDASVTDFINSVPDETKRTDSFTLLELFTRVTKERPRIWGTAIIGFGSYHYKSETSSQEGDWPLIGFSPRKQNLTLYIMMGLADYSDLLQKLGKHKVSSGSCVYINKLSDVDIPTLEKLVARSYQDMKEKHAS